MDTATWEISSVGDTTPRLARTVLRYAREGLTLLARGTRVQSLLGARARTSSRTAGPISSVTAPHETSAFDASEVTGQNLHLAHALAPDPLAALVTMTEDVDPRTRTATAVVYAQRAGYLLPLHRGPTPRQCRPEVWVGSLRIPHITAPVTLRLAGRMLVTSGITRRTRSHQVVVEKKGPRCARLAPSILRDERGALRTFRARSLTFRAGVTTCHTLLEHRLSLAVTEETGLARSTPEGLVSIEAPSWAIDACSGA